MLLNAHFFKIIALKIRLRVQNFKSKSIIITIQTTLFERRIAATARSPAPAPAPAPVAAPTPAFVTGVQGVI